MWSRKRDKVDDEEGIRRAMAITLTDAGYQVRQLQKRKPSSLSVLWLSTDFSARRDFLAGAQLRAHCEPERVVGSVLGFLCCVGAKILPHTIA